MVGTNTQDLEIQGGLGRLSQGMTTDAIYEGRRLIRSPWLDWSHQVSAMGTTRWVKYL